MFCKAKAVSVGVSPAPGTRTNSLIETVDLMRRPFSRNRDTHLPDWWNIQDKKGSTPFEIALLFLGIGLA